MEEESKKNVLVIIIIFVALVAIVYLFSLLNTNPTSYSASTITTPTKSIIYLDSVDCSRGEYNWFYCKGYVVNNDRRSHSVSAYIDLYDSDGTKIDHLLIFKNVDAKGKTAFDATSTDAENYRKIEYKYYIDDVYSL